MYRLVRATTTIAVTQVGFFTTNAMAYKHIAAKRASIPQEHSPTIKPMSQAIVNEVPVPHDHPGEATFSSRMIVASRR